MVDLFGFAVHQLGGHNMVYRSLRRDRRLIFHDTEFGRRGRGKSAVTVMVTTLFVKNRQKQRPNRELENFAS